jgi:hypothetical protein
MESLPPATAINGKWYEVWMDVWMHPGEEAFRGILKEQNHSATRGFIWVAVSSLILAVVSAFGYIPLYRTLTSQFGSTPEMQLFAGGTIVTSLICALILTPISAIIGLAISSGIYHLISRLFRSTGNYSDLVFCMAAVTAPAMIIGAILSIPVLLFSNFPAIWWLVAIFISILSVIIAVYVIVMNVNAIRGAEQIGTWQAILTIFIPVIALGVLSFCCVALTVPATIRSFR